MMIVFNRGQNADPVTVKHDEIAISLFGHCEEQHLGGQDWWVFGRRPLSIHRRAAGSRFRYASTALEIRLTCLGIRSYRDSSMIGEVA